MIDCGWLGQRQGCVSSANPHQLHSRTRNRLQTIGKRKRNRIIPASRHGPRRQLLGAETSTPLDGNHHLNLFFPPSVAVHEQPAAQATPTPLAHTTGCLNNLTWQRLTPVLALLNYIRPNKSFQMTTTTEISAKTAQIRSRKQALG